MKYDFRVLNEHYVVMIDGHHYILDTGSPMSFQIGDGPDSVMINGRRYALSGLGNYIGLRHVDQLVGEPVEGLLGNDVMKALGTVCLDFEHGQISFGEAPDFEPTVQVGFHVVHPFDAPATSAGMLEELIAGLVNALGGADSVRARLAHNFGVTLDYLATDVMLDGKPGIAILDTGACISYAFADLLNGAPVTGKSEDWAPGRGKLRATEHEVQMVLDNALVQAAVSEAPGSVKLQLNMLGAQAVLGFKHLKARMLAIDFGSGKVLAA